MKLFFLLFLAGAVFQAPAAETPAPAQPPSKLEVQVEKFAEEPFPAPGGILLVGSSIFRQWKTAPADLAPLPVTNRAFGGSHTSHQLRFFDRVVPPCRPDLVVWYCGSNDVKNGKDPAEVVARTREWIGQVQTALPGAGIVLVSVMNSPQKRRDGQAQAVREVNRGLAGLADGSKRIFYLEINPAFETKGGEPRTDLYVEDGLHLNAEGYRRMAEVIRPELQSRWKPERS